MRLRVQSFINNEFRVSVQTDNPKPKKVSDTASVRRNTKYHTALQKVMYLDKAIAKLLTESPEIIREKNIDGTQLSLFGTHQDIGVSYKEKTVLPKSYKCLTELPDGRMVVSNRSTDELLRERKTQLDIISESQEQPKRKHSFGEKQTPKSFTKTARHRLLEAGAAIDLLGLKDSSSLLTLTLPGGTEEAKRALADWSGWIVNRQTQALRDRSRFKDVHWFFVWEWQDRGALHQHWCVSAHDYETAQAASMLLKSMWYQLLDELGFNLGIDMYMRAGHMHSWKNYPKMWVWNEQKVKKSVGSYFAKYASKEHLGTKKKRYLASEYRYYPSRWFGSSTNIKQVCKAYRIDISLHNVTKNEAEEIKHQVIVELEKFKIIQRFEYEFEAVREYTVGLTFRKQTDKKTGELNKIYELKQEKENFEQCYCSGATAILYVNPIEFVGAFSSISRWVSSSRSRVSTGQTFYRELQFAREKIARIDCADIPEFNPKYGKLNVVC